MFSFCSKTILFLFIFSATSNHQEQQSFRLQPPNPVRPYPAVSAANMVANTSSEATSADFRKQRAVLKKDLQRKFERWDKDPHDRTRYLESKSLLESWGITFLPD